jgi:peptidoglycan-N-acetylglucosamine deacetylase
MSGARAASTRRRSTPRAPGETVRLGFAERRAGHLRVVWRRTLTLTFDDGPDPRWTPEVLRALDADGVLATFFMIGERVLEYPAVAACVRAAGHEIQLHCHRHTRHSEMSEQAIGADARAGIDALDAAGVRASRWRTPWGISSPATITVARRLGLELVGWTHDSHDLRGDSAASMLDRMLVRLREGGTVLMHDSPGSLRDGCQNTIELLAPLIAAARERGLQVSPGPRVASALLSTA